MIESYNDSAKTKSSSHLNRLWGQNSELLLFLKLTFIVADTH